VTAEAAEQGGIRTSVMPAEYTLAGLVRAIVEHVERRTPARAPSA